MRSTAAWWISAVWWIDAVWWIGAGSAELLARDVASAPGSTRARTTTPDARAPDHRAVRARPTTLEAASHDPRSHSIDLCPAVSVTEETCPFDVCDGSGFVVDDATNTARDCRCRAQRVGRLRARSLSGVIPRKYRGVSFDRPPVTEIAPPVTAAVRRFVNRIDENLDGGRGLWFFGSVGTGKTTLAMLVSRHALEAGRSVAIYSLPRLLAEIRTTFDDDRGGDSYVDLLDRLTAVDLLHIDDVGAEKTSPWVLEQLYAIVNARYEDERSIIITTNLERDELAEQINERTVSRLEEMCEVLPLWGADARQQRPDVRSA